jgi:hypothetical protein
MEGHSRYKLTRDDMVAQLREQLSFLELSGRAFDEGAEGEAKRLAVVVRVLVHDTRSSVSLLRHLSAKDTISYLNTADRINPANLAPTLGLVYMEMSNEGFRYVARLGDPPPRDQRPRWKAFIDWWTDPVTKDGRGELFSRRDYVLTLSNREGGAHVEHSLDARYAELTRNNSFGWSFGQGGEEPKPVDHNPAPPSVRQIAYEIEQTIRHHPLKLGLS